MTYAEQLKHPKWQRKRLEILQRDNFKCTKCGDEESTLHVHHIEYTKGGKAWEIDNKKLATLCEHCHKEFESASDHISFDEFKSVVVWDGLVKVRAHYVGYFIAISAIGIEDGENLGKVFLPITMLDFLHKRLNHG